MNTRIRCYIGFTLISLFLLALPPDGAASGNDPARKTALETSKAEAATLLEKGRTDDAYDLYRRLIREAPDDDAVVLGLARSGVKAGRWNQAVMAYEILLEKYPREAVLYGELANVYMLLGDRSSAERSLAMMRSLDESVTREDTDKALDTLESRYDRLQVHGKVQVGMLYDSNANMGPRSNTMDLGTWRVKVHDAREKSSFAAYLGADLDVGWRLERDSSWWVVGDVQGFLRGNTNSDLHDSRSQESQWGRGAAGIRHLTSTTLADIRLKAEIFDYELYQNVSAIGPEGTFLWAVTPTVHLITRAGIDRRTYSKNSRRNGMYGWAGEYLRLFFGSENHEFLAGARYVGATAKETDYGFDGWEGSVRFLFKLPHGIEVGPFVSFTQEYYRGPATMLETRDRKDERWRVGTTLTYRINESWSIDASYQYTDNDSRSNLYKYDQHVTTIGVSWNF